MYYLAPFLRYSKILVKKTAASNLPHLYLAPPFGMTPWNFAEIFGVRKLESLGYRVALSA